MDYFNKPLTQHNFDLLNKSNNISREKCDLFADIIITLTHYVYNTYLGDDVISSNEDQISHFNWCWDKTLNCFAQENINIDKHGNHLDYFSGYYAAIFYDSPCKDKKLFKSMVVFWGDIFNSEVKTQIKYEVFIEAYSLLDKALFRKKLKNPCFSV